MAENNIDKIKALREDYKKTFDCPEGKRVLKHMEDVGFWRATTFVPNDPMATCFNEGTRSFLLHIKTLLEMDIEQLEKIAKETEG